MSGAATGQAGIQELEEITPNVTSTLQTFCALALDNLKVYRPEIVRLDGLIAQQGTYGKVLEVDIRKLEGELSVHQSQSAAQAVSVAERLTRIEAVLHALPSWKEELLHRIDSVHKEVRMSAERASARAQQQDDRSNAHVQSTRERLDALADVQQAAADVRVQQQARIDALNQEIRDTRIRHAEQLALLETSTMRQAEEQRTQGVKLAEHGASIGMLRMDMDRTRDMAGNTDRQLQTTKREQAEVQLVVEGLQGGVGLIKRAVAGVESEAEALGRRLVAAEQEVNVRCCPLENAKRDLYAWKEEVQSFERQYGKDKDVLGENLRVLHAKCDAGPPGIWKVASQVAATAEDVVVLKARTAEAQAAVEELQRGMDAARAAHATAKDRLGQVEADTQAAVEKTLRESGRLQAYMEERTESLARRYEVEGLKAAMDELAGTLRSEMAAAAEKLKFGLLRDERSEVGSIREYLDAFESSQAATKERLTMVEVKVAAEGERAAQATLQARDMRAELDGMASNAKSELARLRRQLGSLSEEYDQLSLRARAAGAFTGDQVSSIIDSHLDSRAMEAWLARKLAGMGLYPATPAGAVVTARTAAVCPLSGHGASSRNPTQHHTPGLFTLSPRMSAPASTQQHVPSLPSSPPASPMQQQHNKPLQESQQGGLGQQEQPRSAGGDLEHAHHPPEELIPFVDADGLEASVAAARMQVAAREAGSVSVSPRISARLLAADSGGLLSPSTSVDRQVAAVMLHVQGHQAGLSHSTAQLSPQHVNGSHNGGVKHEKGGILDPDLSRRMAALEADIAALASNQRHMSQAAAPNDLATITSRLEEVRSAVTVLQASMGVGAPGEAAVRRHVHATLLPEVLTRQSQEVGRVLGYVRTQLSGAARASELWALRRMLAALARHVALLANQTLMLQQQKGGSMANGMHLNSQQLQHELQALAAAASSAWLPAAGTESEAQGQAASSPAEVTLREVEDVRTRLSVLEASQRAMVSRKSQAVTGPRDKQASPAGAAAASNTTRVLSDDQLVELQGRIMALEQAAPLHAKTFEVEALRRMVMDARQALLDPTHAAAAAASALALLGVQALDVHCVPEEATVSSVGALAGSSKRTQARVGHSTSENISKQNVPANLRRSAKQRRSKTSGSAQSSGPPSAENSLPDGASGDAADEAAVPSDLPARLEAALEEGYDKQPGSSTAMAIKEASQAAANVGHIASQAVVHVPKATSSQVTQLATRVHSAQLDAALKRLGAVESMLSLVDARGRSLEDTWSTAQVRWGLTLNETQHALPRLQAGIAALAASVLRSDSQSAAAAAGPRAADRGHGGSGDDNALGSMRTYTLVQPFSACTGAAAARSAVQESRSSSSPDREAEGSPARTEDVFSHVMASAPSMSGPSMSVRELAQIQQLSSSSVFSFGPAYTHGPQESGPLRSYNSVMMNAHSGAGTTRLPAATSAAHLACGTQPETANTELAGIAYDLAHVGSELMRRVRDGPLPDGTEGGVPTAAATQAREAALARLRSKPAEVVAHVELLEAVKLHMARLLHRSAGSTTDHLVLVTAMMDMRLRLTEDRQEVLGAQIQQAHRSVEQCLLFMAQLQDAVNDTGKGSAAAIANMQALLTALSFELGAAVGAGSKLGDGDFWRFQGSDMGFTARPSSPTARAVSPQSARLGGPGVLAAVYRQQVQSARGTRRPSPTATASPAPAPAAASAHSGSSGGAGGGAAAAGSSAAGTNMLPLSSQSIVTAGPANLPGFMPSSPLPPPNFLKDKRDLMGEMEKMLAAAGASPDAAGAASGSFFAPGSPGVSGRSPSMTSNSNGALGSGHERIMSARRGGASPSLTLVQPSRPGTVVTIPTGARGSPGLPSIGGYKAMTPGHGR